MSKDTPITRRRVGRPAVIHRKEFPVHALLDAQTKAAVERVTSRRQESQSCFLRRAVLELLQRETQTA
ncbi:hypothetical protein [Frateuria sp. Soil773]|uniref:hypothetical protein n=1 Tax=Frateuria sp. Soil773 TaxID=1736407 RepID=UPI0012F9E5BB|nr:hypothetical protein [Frateuria sp. Soil773]